MDSPSVCLSSPQTVLWGFVLLLPWSWATVFNHVRVACCLRCWDFHSLQDLTCCVWLLPLINLCTITFFYQKQQESTRQHKQASGLEPHCCPCPYVSHILHFPQNCKQLTASLSDTPSEGFYFLYFTRKFWSASHTGRLHPTCGRLWGFFSHSSWGK